MNPRSDNPAPEALLTHEDFVRGLVRSLLRGADGEDDVVQNTWMRALANPPRDAGAGRQWLATVARNMVRDHQRGETRRTRHERRAARLEELPSAADVLNREDERRRVIDAVLGLSDPYRTVVLLHYWEGLPSRAIAVRLGIPDATVRSQVRRGLEMLRQKLDTKYGSRDCWVVALIPCTGFSNATNLSTGVILMSIKSKTVLTACGLFLAGIALFGFYNFGEVSMPLNEPGALPVDSEQVSHRQAAELRESGSTAGATNSNPVSDERTVIASKGAFTLSGSVTDNGKPVPDLLLKVQWYRGYGASGIPGLEVSVRTNAAGQFVWRGPKLDVGRTVQATSENTLFKLSCEQVLVQPNQASANLRIRAIPLACQLHGVVSNDAGEGIAGARITVRIVPGDRWPGTETDAQGKYSLRVARDHHRQNICIWAPDYTPRTVVTQIPATADDYELDFVLQAGARVSGRVIDEGGKPIADVRIGTSAPHYYVKTDSKGRFELTSLSPVTEHHIVAFKPGYLRVGETLAVGTQDAEFVLRPGSVLFGRVLDAAGHGVAGAKISCSQTGYSGVDGSFRIQGIAEGKGHVVVTKAGFVRHFSEMQMPTKGLELVVHLETSYSVRGRVTDSQGLPVADASVHLAIRRSMAEPSTKTDRDGYFALAGLSSAKAIEIGVFKNGYQLRIVSNVVVGPTSIGIRLERGASIRGRVLDSETKQPIDRFGLRIATTNDEWSFRRAPVAIDGTDGYWQSRGQTFKVGQALYLLLEAEGYAPARATTTAAIDPPRDQCVVLMKRAASITGTVRDQVTGLAIANATIKVVDANAKHLGMLLIHATAFPTTTSDSSGSFAFTSLDGGSVKLIVTHPGYTEEIHGPVEIQIGLRSRVDLQLGRGSTVRGRIEGFDGMSLNVGISSREGHGKSQKLKLGARRDFLFEGVGDGRNLISITAGESFVLLRTRWLTIADTDVDNIVFIEEEGPCSVAVTVTGLDAGEGRCWPSKGTEGTIRGFEYQEGTFTLTGLRVGTHWIRIGNDRRTVKQEVTLAPGKPKALSIDFGK